MNASTKNLIHGTSQLYGRTLVWSIGWISDSIAIFCNDNEVTKSNQYLYLRICYFSFSSYPIITFPALHLLCFPSTNIRMYWCIWIKTLPKKTKTKSSKRRRWRRMIYIRIPLIESNNKNSFFFFSFFWSRFLEYGVFLYPCKLLWFKFCFYLMFRYDYWYRKLTYYFFVSVFEWKILFIFGFFVSSIQTTTIR